MGDFASPVQDFLGYVQLFDNSNIFTAALVFTLSVDVYCIGQYSPTQANLQSTQE